MLVALTLAPPGAAAHEAGTTAVTATLKSSRFVIDIVCDPAAVVARLDAAAGRARSPRLTIGEYQERLAALGDEFIRQVDVRFDGRPVGVALEGVTAADDRAPGSPEEALASPRVAIRLTGPVPGGSRSFSWSYGLTFVSYAFIVREAGSSVGRMEWLDGDQESQPFALSMTSRLGPLAMAFAVIPLFVLSLLLTRGRLLRLVTGRSPRGEPWEPREAPGAAWR
jgi:hypothetical protein